MKRKVIQLAGKTFVVSLPTSWARQWGVKKGEEIEVTENGPKLIISTAKPRDVKKGNVDLTKASERTIRWVLSSLHKKGYDEIEVITDKPEQAALIDELLKDLFIGFAVIHRTNNRCIIRSLSRELDDQFDTVLRRAFLITLTLTEQSYEALKQGKPLTKLLELEKTNNQLTNFCERMLNKHGHQEPVKSMFLYTIIWNLEKIADDYKYICQERKATEKTLQIYERTNQLLRKYYELFYGFSIKLLDELADEQKKLYEDIKKELTSSKDTIILSHLMHIVLKTADFSASMFALNQS
ncbi:MAG TPA: AbrB/MazE/SpoVT family DNA-binding domain-containing protein [Candidatus Nanoarchaeia archaeon]|nr:AbrB/MazE/SpoVT family DNA-binding domain-containing protein [Candidatus Nanoarchaeia archaeon]